jgi:uncharacterized protein YdaU (DUF1376 family)
MSRRRRSSRGRGATKSPAYQWYPKDALSDGAMSALSNEAEGVYRRFLDYAWLEDGIPADLDLLYRWGREPNRAKFDQLWMTIERFFPIGPDGKRRNPRQEEERKKQRKNSKVKRLAAETRWQKQHALCNARASQEPCLALALALPLADLSSKAEEQRAFERARPVDAVAKKAKQMRRMKIPVWSVRTHLLSAVHQLIASGAPYLDASGQPVFSELHDELKNIATRQLHAEWEGDELRAILDAALGRRAVIVEANVLREGFRRRRAKEFDRAVGGRYR